MKNAGLFVILFFRKENFSKSTCFLLAGLAKECSCMKKKKLLFAILCALGSGTVGFFANQLTEVYGCI